MDLYNYLIHDKADPRTASWLLVASPWPMVAICILYLLIVWQGPKLMDNRPALNLKYPLILYNFGLVCLSWFTFREFLICSIYTPNFSFLCQAVDYSMDPLPIRFAGAVWWFYISKPIEMLDTVFFILRKKNGQVTFLHVYHHVTMVPLWWLGVKYVPGGESYFSPTLNCLVHGVMYTYYMLSAFGPHMQKWLWWKKYITKLQLTQFAAIVIHTTYATILPSCKFPKLYLLALIFYCFSQIVLFSNFYHKAYMTKKSSVTNGAVNMTHKPSLLNGVRNGTLVVDNDSTKQKNL